MDVAGAEPPLAGPRVSRRQSTRIGVISNPGSRRNRRGLAEVRAVLAGEDEVTHVETDGVHDLAAALAELARREVDLLVVNGGDGTVQRVLTELLEARPFDEPPALAVLARGMANMTAGDVGLRGRAAPALRRLLAAARRGELERHVQIRPVLRVENARDLPPQRAMFFGAGAIYDAIDFCCREVYTRGLEGNLGMGVTLAGLLLGGPGRAAVIRGHEVALTLDDAPEEHANLLLLLATTLERLVLATRPFWGARRGTMHVTSIAYPPVHMLRAAPKVLYGWRPATLDPGCYRSRSVDRLALRMASSFTLDGELFEPAPDHPLLLSAPEAVRFVRL